MKLDDWFIVSLKSAKSLNNFGSGIPFKSCRSTLVDGTPTNLILTVINDIQINLSWTAGSTNHVGHSVERSLTGTSGWSEIVIVLGATVTYNNTGLTQSTQYYYRVRAYKGTSYSSYTNIAFATTLANAISDGNTKGEYIADDIANITVDSAMLSSLWKDRLGSGRDLLGDGADNTKPTWGGQGMYFNGSLSTMKAIFAWNQPCFIYIVMKQITWTLNDIFFDGNTNNSMNVRQNPTTPSLLGFAGAYGLQNDNMPLDTFCILRILFNGANSKIQVNATTASSGNLGTANPGAFTLGSYGGRASGYSNIRVRHIILRSVDDTGTSETNIYNYLVNKYTALYNLYFLGDSIFSNYGSASRTDSFIIGVYNIQNRAHSGDTIANQKAAWGTYGSATDNVIMMIGLNDINNARTELQVSTDLQDLVDTVRTTIGSSNKIIICTLTPIRQAFGDTKYNVWLAVNNDIKGVGTYPITGVDAVVSSHTDTLNDGSGNLAATYDTGDHIHPMNNGRNVIAVAIKVKLTELLL